MARPQSCAEFTMLLMILLVGGIFGAFFVVANTEETVGSSEPITEEDQVVIQSIECVWTWNYDTDSEGATRLQAALEADGFTDVVVAIDTFGETCTLSNPDFEGYSLVMDSSPQITIPLDDAALLGDNAALGDMIARILPLIDNAGLTTPREIVITFQVDGQSREWRAMSNDLDRSLTGAAMFEQGTSNP